MIPIPYLREACCTALVLCIAAIGVQTVRLKVCKSELKAAEAALDLAAVDIRDARSTIVDLSKRITDQTQRIADAALAGAKAQAQADALARKARELGNVKRLLEQIQSENLDLREQMEGLSPCESCDLALRSIAGGLP